MKKKKIKIPIYYGDLFLIQTDDFEKVEKKYNLTSLHGVYACAWDNPKKNGESRFYMLFSYDCDPVDIAHEALHVTNFICKSRNISVDMNNDEPRAYLLGWIVQQCHDFLKIK